ncbi:glycosyltransferase [Nibrella saemangeumensis]|uniref:Glycosyltransferase n=1 Tax=Nibrella saemangeumensis TaxID=1084526 RepID=A0ABP8NCB3_9BACT
MRILNICAYTWSIGGPPKIIYDHTKVAIARGHQVDILSPMSPGDEIYPVPEGARVIPCLRNPPVSNYFKEFSVELYRYLKQHIHEYDIIHCHGIWHFGSVAPFLIDRTVPKVITIHGLLDRWTYRVGYWKKQLMSFVLQKRLVERADLVQINNTDEEQDLLRYLGHRHPNTVIIPNGIPLQDFAVLPPKGSFRQQYGIPADKKMVLFMSRLNRKKGLDLLLPAFHRYTRDYTDAVLVLAGPDDGYQAATNAYIADHGLQDRIIRVGMITGDTKKAALADANIFVLPSYSEGFSMAVLETMAAGLPALLSDRVGFGEVIRQRKAACLVELNTDSVYAGLKELLHNDAYREQVRQNALNLVREQYDIEVVAGRLLDEYDKILRR